VKSGANDGT